MPICAGCGSEYTYHCGCGCFDEKDEGCPDCNNTDCDCDRKTEERREKDKGISLDVSPMNETFVKILAGFIK
jgi:hypothetical protein